MPDTPMTVGDLRAALLHFGDDLPIILAKDEEGNGFRSLWDVEASKCMESHGEKHPIHEDDVAEYSPEVLFDVVVLWP